MAVVSSINETFDTPGTLGNPPWLTTSGSIGAPVVASGQAGPGATNGNYSVLHVDTLDSDDMEVGMVLGAVTNNFSMLWIGAPNGSTTGSGGTLWNTVALQFSTAGLEIYTVNASGTATLRATLAIAIASGDAVVIRRVGDVYMGILNGVVRVSWTDTTNVIARSSSSRAVGFRVNRTSGNASPLADTFYAKSILVPSFVAASSASINTAGTTVTCSYPAGSASGDLLVMYAGFQRTASGAFTIATPSGWNLLDTDIRVAGTNYMGGVTFWRFRGAETSVSVVASIGTSTFGTVQIHAYRGAIDQTNPVEASTIGYSGTTSSSAARTFSAVTTTVDDCAVSYLMVIEKTLTGTLTFGGGPANGSTAAERVDAYSGTTGDLLFGSATAAQLTAGSTGSVTVTPSATSNETFLATVAIRAQHDLTVSGSDTGSTAAEDGTVTAQVPADDTSGTGVDTASGVSLSGVTDSASGLDDVVAVQVQGDDSGSGLDDVSLLTAQLVADDLGAGVDDGTMSSQVFADDASQAGLDDAGVAPGGATDSGSGSEGGSLSAADMLADDAGSGLEDAAVTVAADDAGTGAEEGAGNTAHAVDDDGAFVDTASGPILGHAESGSGLDDAAVVADLAGDDAGTSVDDSRILVDGADLGSGLDNATLAIPESDSGSGADEATISVHIFATDGGSLDDDALVSVSGDDSGVGGEAAFIFIDGVGVIGARVVRVQPEARAIPAGTGSRVVHVIAEERLSSIPTESRRIKPVRATSTSAVPSDGVTKRRVTSVPVESRRIRISRDPFLYQVPPEGRLRIFGRDSRTVLIAPSQKDPVRVRSVEGEDGS